MKQIVVIIVIVIALVFLGNSIFAKGNPELDNKYETAKMNLILGEFELAKDQFKDLEMYLNPVKDQNDFNKEMYKDVMFNIGLIYEQINEEKNQKVTNDNVLMGHSSEDLFFAKEYFNKSDPDLLKKASIVNKKDSSYSKTRSVTTIVSDIIFKKVGNWLNNTDNCSVIFTEEEINSASKAVVLMSKHSDVVEILELDQPDKKIREMISRFKKYSKKFKLNDPINFLFKKKVFIKCSN